jgi:hypothetical protein
MTNGKSPKSRGDLHENATAKQIPKQDTKKGIGHGESEGQESMCGWI